MISSLRDIALVNQGLCNRKKFGEGLNGTIQAIDSLGYVQIDTLSVVERAHHHVLWSRVSNYEQDYLNILTRQKEIFEYWFHAASYLPIKDYRFSLFQKDSIKRGENRYFNFSDKKLMNEILHKIKIDGELKLRGIEKEGKNNKGAWWNFGPARRALEQLFMQGDVMICERVGMEKVYNLTEFCIPDNIDQTIPTIQEYALYLFNSTMRAHGVFTWKQLLHLKVGKKIRDTMNEIIQEKIQSKEIICIKNIFSEELYVDSELFNKDNNVEKYVKILSPFDNLLIHRDRLKLLFNFDYRVECYVPAEKRIYGYFCLPILFGNEIVGRIDCKAHRSEKKMEIISFHKEKASNFDEDQFYSLLRSEVINFSKFNKCLKVEDNSKIFDI